jgi:undecaprenyl diphosphate synthase
VAAQPKPVPAEVPAAVAIVMDGNSRWAASRGLSVAEGHRAGSRALRPVVETSIDLGIESLAVFAGELDPPRRGGERADGDLR